MSTENKPYKEVTIFLVEDDDVDAMAVQRALKQLKLLNPVVRARDGMEALELLKKDDAVRKPFIVLLDISMPRMNGFEFLKALRDDPQHAQTVVFVLTTSESEQDRFSAYKQNVAGYIVKQRVEEGFMKVVEMLNLYWRLVELPQ